jgi:glucosamine--fructose-6-phosphate aminotransferase (isomerizing)
MCGIIGYVGHRKAMPVLIDGLERLEYRGYDSAGVVILKEGGFFHEKCAGKIESLKKRLAPELTGQNGCIGIGHTRWATHGAPTSENAHPHFSCDRKIVLVHNGIIENFMELRERLADKGHAFASQTDTETLVHLVEEAYEGDPLKAVAAAIRQVRGSFAMVVMFADQHDLLIGARQFSPLIIGVGKEEGERFIASDIPAILPYTNMFNLVEDGQIIELRKNKVSLYDFNLKPQKPKATTVHQTYDAAQKHGFDHFMLKEIHEQPQVIQREIAGRIDGETAKFDELELSDKTLAATKRVLISACGTAWHAGMFAKYVIEDIAGIPVDIGVSSEVRYSPPPLPKGSIVIAISQSGETADTLQAVRVGNEARVPTIGLTNTPPSSLAREAKGVIYNRAGIEVGVAATKTYVAQLTALLLLGVKLGRLTKKLSKNRAAEILKALNAAPKQVEDILAQSSSIQVCARRFASGHDFMYIGRRYNVATAFEGALKMKEISYLRAEGYAAGEMKHGPLALVDEKLVTLAIACQGLTYEKLASNIQEIRARNGKIVSLVTKGDSQVKKMSDVVFEMPETEEIVSPLTSIVPLQLLAYYTATALGRDVDKPRNLAKSVTVE